MRLVFHWFLLILTPLFLAASAAVAGSSSSAAPWMEILPQPVLSGLVHLPGLLVTGRDTVLVIAQSRITRGDHDPSDVVVTRSADRGLTWSAPMKLYVSDGATDIGYSCMLVEDRTTVPATILAYYTVGPAGWKSHQLIWYGRRSTDEGLTWGEPFRVRNDGHAESKPSNGGHGFEASSGRLVIPGRGNYLYSDDGGLSWTTAGQAETVETKVVPVAAQGRELDAVYLITRRSTTYRIYLLATGELLEEGDHGNIFTTLGRNPGLARHAPGGSARPVLLMSGIPDMTNRVFSIAYSIDEGRTWSDRKRIDEQGWYSDIGVTRDGTIIVAYTVGFSDDLKIARCNLAWVRQR